jgi:AraC family transcriptional regulator
MMMVFSKRGYLDMSAGSAFGDVIARHLGLNDAPALVARPVRETQLGVSWLSCGADRVGRKQAIPPEDSFVVMLHLADYQHHELWRCRQRHISAACYPKDSICIVNLIDELSANVGGPLEVLSFYIPRPTLDAFTDEALSPRVADLSCAPAIIDPVLANLGAALLPAFERPAEASALFVDQVSLALQAHVAVTYGGLQLPVRRTGGLLRWQEMRAKDYLTATISSEVSIAEVATTCNLSRSYFIRAFKKTTGRTPHRWLLEHRIDRAKELLLHSRPIAEIALECGFSDQSHFTRVFTNLMGMPPGVWRRQCSSPYLGSTQTRTIIPGR